MTDIPEINLKAPQEPSLQPIDAALVQMVQALKALGDKTAILTAVESLLVAVVSGASAAEEEQDQLLRVLFGRVAVRVAGMRKPKLHTTAGRA